ncbi:hypothetical protein Tco_1132260 [Tanacetum coccineum]|uniref:Reverse transcriptase domain-containing protein n=1 Tax=Tanacetum coccineum TaxID=301880 RepID=A0ABQ5JBE8_9ASTR
MSSSTHPIIVPSDYDVEDAFSSTHSPDYIPASPDYFPASPGNTSPDPSDDLSKYLLASLAISPFHDDPYMKVMQAYNATSNESPIPLPQAPIAPPTVLPPSPVLPLSPMFDPQDFFLPEEILPPQKRARFLSSSSTNFSSAHLRTPTSAAPAMSQAAIRKLVADTVAAALEAQAATVANDDNTNRNTRQSGTPVARKCSYKEFMICKPFIFKGTEGAVGFIRWFERTESVFFRSNCTEDCKVKFLPGKILKTTLEDPVIWAVNDQLRCNSKKLMEVFIEGLPMSIKGNVTASKPQTLEEAITITQRLMDQVTKHNYVQGTNDHKRKFDDRRTFTNNKNYQNNHNNNKNHNNDYQQQHNRRQETVRAYVVTPTRNNRNCRNKGPATGSNLQPVLERVMLRRNGIKRESESNGKQQSLKKRHYLAERTRTLTKTRTEVIRFLTNLILDLFSKTSSSRAMGSDAWAGSKFDGIILDFLTKLLVSEYICAAALMLCVMVLSSSKGRYSRFEKSLFHDMGFMTWMSLKQALRLLTLYLAQISNRSVTEKVFGTENALLNDSLINTASVAQFVPLVLSDKRVCTGSFD